MLTAFALSLGLTLAIELSVALLWGIRRRDLLLVALVNLLTNPAVLLLHLLARSLPATLLLEAAAICVEALYYQRYGARIRQPWLFSCAANVVSFSLGLFFNSLL